MNNCYLALGSNLKSPERQIRFALRSLKQLPASYLLKVAPFYKSKAVGRKCQPYYCNTVVLLKTRLPPIRVLKLCQAIENKQGRTRRVRWGARTLDLDILFYNAFLLYSKELSLPHPRFHLRDFVLIPLLNLFRNSISEATYFVNSVAPSLFLTGSDNFFGRKEKLLS